MLEASTGIRCMRDPTRGGLVTALNDFAVQSNTGIEVDEEAVPVNSAVLAACELLGLEPMHIANEGKLVAVVPAEDAGRIIGAMKEDKYGTGAVAIGRVVAEHPRRVVMKTVMGSSRILDMPAGELLPRIC